jgi:two-component system phosphate regulon sensor histidine kinase PhoR
LTPALAARVAGDLAYAAITPGKVYALAYPETGEQLFYVQSRAAGGGEIVAMLVNLDYAMTNAFGRAQKITGVKAALVNRSSLDERQHLPRTLFPFWAIVQPEPDEQPAPYASLLLVALPLAVGGGLAAGLWGLLREHSRELQNNRLQANLVTGVAHELKTPLTTIQLYGNFVQDTDRFTGDERARFGRVLSSQLTELSRRIDSVLEFSRLGHTEKVYTREATDVSNLIEALLAAHRFRFEAQGFTIEALVEPGLPKVELDAIAVTDAILNLMENAAKYSKNGRRIAIGARRQDGGIVIEVRDWGDGIPRRLHRRIFQPFYRVEEQRSGRGGFGLGLFLVGHIMQGHGGRVEVESEPGRGSVFRLIFPERCIRYS